MTNRLKEETDRLGEALDALQPHVPGSLYRMWRHDLEVVREALAEDSAEETHEQDEGNVRT